MTIQLTPEQMQFVRQQLATGDYADENEVVARALGLWQQYQEKVTEVQAGVQRGIEDMDAGRYRTLSTPEEAQVLADEIKQRGRGLRAKREQAAH